MDKYQEDPPSNQQWTDGDDISGVAGFSTHDWNVIPLTRDELYGFCGLQNAVKQMLQNPHPSTFEHFVHFHEVMRLEHERWTGGFEI